MTLMREISVSSSSERVGVNRRPYVGAQFFLGVLASGCGAAAVALLTLMMQYR
ncbi:hypothetical protein [Nocardia acidivorans]|uniref:hypothetical protein n=1 Tax=Nocardia acidivorans TaxID=404580 RepID=UPI0012F78D5C|nr:hypothetical protein [Nocardia acidivorans]